MAFFTVFFSEIGKFSMWQAPPPSALRASEVTMCSDVYLLVEVSIVTMTNAHMELELRQCFNTQTPACFWLYWSIITECRVVYNNRPSLLSSPVFRMVYVLHYVIVKMVICTKNYKISYYKNYKIVTRNCNNYMFKDVYTCISNN